MWVIDGQEYIDFPSGGVVGVKSEVHFDPFIHIGNQTAPTQVITIVVGVISKGVLKIGNMFFDGRFVGVFIQVPARLEMVPHITPDTPQLFLKTLKGHSVKIGGFFQ